MKVVMTPVNLKALSYDVISVFSDNHHPCKSLRKNNYLAGFLLVPLKVETYGAFATYDGRDGGQFER